MGFMSDIIKLKKTLAAYRAYLREPRAFRREIDKFIAVVKESNRQ